MTAKPPKKRRKGDSSAKALKDATIISQAMSGKRVVDIAGDMGMDRNQISKILNSDEVKEKVKEIQGRLANGIDKAIEVFLKAVDDYEMDRVAALSAARDILKNFGALQTKVEMEHKFPRAVVIMRRDGTEVVLGTTEDLGKGEEKE